MDFMKKFFKKKQKREDEELVEDDLNYDSNSSDDSNKIEELHDDLDELNNDDDKVNSASKLNFNLKSNPKRVKQIGGVIIVGAALYLASPMLINTLQTQGIMDSQEYEQTVKDVNELSSSINEDPELIARLEAEEKAKMAKIKADREAKKLKKEQEQPSFNKVEKETIEEPITNEVKEPIALAKENTLNQVIVEKPIEVLSENVDNRNNDLANGKNFIGKDGNVKIDKIEDKMGEQFDHTMKRIESTSLDHNSTDQLDPFIQEYTGTINSRAMSNELIENVRLMKEYIGFLETKKQFEEAKLIYEQKKRKNIFEDEVNKVKGEFLIELEDMKKSFDDLKKQNQDLSTQLSTSNRNKELDNLKAMDDQIANRKADLNLDVSQKVYKIGFNYLLEEKDSEGNVKVYRDGNAYRGNKIVQITPDFLKVKQENGSVSILPINEESNPRSDYSRVSIPTPKKIEVENESSGNNSSSNNSKKVENYSNVQNKTREETINNNKNLEKTENNREQQLKSRFLN